MDLRWYDREFSELSVGELHAIIALRQQVFIVEQAAAYLDVDGLDPVSRHLWAETDGEIAAYLRIVPPGARFAELALGRIVVAPSARGAGLGRVLVQRGLDAVGPLPVRLAAQAHLERFYGGLGFVRASEPYLEDGIWHIEMLRR